MSPRIFKYVIGVVIAAGLCRAGFVHAQYEPPPLHLTSLESFVASSDVIVRGVIVDITPDSGNWNIITLDVKETLKGTKAERVTFAAYQLEKAGATLDQAKKSKREMVWILKDQKSGIPGQAPEREKLLARLKIRLHAPFLPGRPGSPALPVIPLGDGAALTEAPPAFLTIDLRVLKTSDELVKGIRATLAETQGRTPAGSYALLLPHQTAQGTGFSCRWKNYLTVPRDQRLEASARRFVLSPSDFFPKRNAPGILVYNREHLLPKNDANDMHLLRLEGVKVLRQFRSEQNLAIIKAWRDDPMSVNDYKVSGNSQLADLAPALPKSEQATRKVTLPRTLADVPEIHFQQQLTKKLSTPDAQLHTACTIDTVNLLNQKKTDAFIETLIRKRPDLAGLSFAMGDACRMKPEASKQFVAALDVFRKVESRLPAPSSGPTAKEKSLMNYYKEQSPESKINPSARVASLMQVLGHHDAANRLDLAKYLDGLANADATRALAKMAIFSEETDIRTAAVKSLQKRDAKDYTDILVAGLKYPWPAVAERASDAMAKLGRKDLIANLIGVLDAPDPREPQLQEKDGKKVPVVRELVRLNHHHSCLLCHAPANLPNEKDAKSMEGLTAQVPVPSESMVAYYRPSNPDILVRFDVTYLRQDFSMKIKVADADPWPEMQRYDFLVRTREVTEKQALAYRELLQPSRPRDLSPYRRAALSALRELTGQDAEPTAKAWRKLTGS